MNPSTRRVLWLAAFFVLWLVLVGTRTPAELVAGLIASALEALR